MSTIYSLYHPYGNYLDGYYVKNYDQFITSLLSTCEYITESYKNLGITDGCTIINTMKGDYREYNCCIVEDDEGNRDLYKITSKQFIRRGLWQITMIIDAFSKYYTETIESTLLINRLTGIKTSRFSPILFNDEGFTLSKVKTKQTPIYFDGLDHTKLQENARLNGYLVYFQKDTCNGDIILKTTGTIPTADFTVNELAEFSLQRGTILTYDRYADLGVEDVNTSGAAVLNKTIIDWHQWNVFNKKGTAYTGSTENERCLWIDETERHADIVKSQGENYWVFEEDSGYYDDKGISYNKAAFCEAINSYIETALGIDKFYDTYKDYEGKTLYVQSTGNYYRINFSALQTEEKTISCNDRDTLNAAFNKTVWAYGYESGGGINLDVYHMYYIVSLSLLGTYTITNTSLTQKRNTEDQGFAVLWIPKSKNIEIYDKSTKYPLVQSTIDDIITTLIATYGGENAKILDVQETYFVPQEVQELISQDGNKVYIDMKDVSYISQVNTENSAVYFYCYALYSCEGSLYIKQEETIEDYKIAQQNEYILRSPSGATAIEFDIAKNNGVSGYILKYNARPYSSLYQLQPIYNGYYGINFTDTRGLVVEEDMSITQTSDLYETYKRQNVNYINSFNSNQAYERTSLSLQQSFEKEQMKLQSAQGAVNTAIQTGAAGLNATASLLNTSSKKGFRTMYAEQSLIEAGSATLQYGTDQAFAWTQLKNQQEQARKQLQLQQLENRKQWKYSLDNIAALPLNTDKISGIYNTNYGAFYLETYEPTSYELYVYENYLELYGITIGSIIELETDSDYEYIEATIIKYSTSITNEMYDEIASELSTGRRLYVNNEQENEETT